MHAPQTQFCISALRCFYFLPEKIRYPDPMAVSYLMYAKGFLQVGDWQLV